MKATKPPRARKPATPRARRIRPVLEALAQVGVGEERTNAAARLKRLLARYDFAAPEDKLGDMFAGKFAPSPDSRWLASFPVSEQDIAAMVKWAIENATGLRASFRADAVYVQADTSCLTQLTMIASRIGNGCRTLWSRFERAPGVTPADHGLFLRGIYDGMMADGRAAGERLPERRIEAVKGRTKKRALTTAPGIGVHPYTVALDLGRQLRFDAPITDIVGALEEKLGERKELA